MVIKTSNKKVEEKRIVTPKEKKNENFDMALRPKKLEDYIGQEKIKKHLKVSIESAKIRKTPLEHILFYGPPGLWKTTLSNIIVTEMDSTLKVTSGPAIDKQSDIVSILSNLQEWDILFIDEIHRLRANIEEILYTAMEDFYIDIIVWAWTWAQSVRMPVAPFTLIWATTKLSSLSAPLRDRFWNILKLDFYNEKDLFTIIRNNSKKIEIELSDLVLEKIAFRSRWTPRISNRLLKIVRDYVTIWRKLSEKWVIDEIFEDLSIDELWLDSLDKKLLESLVFKFGWAPVWLNTLASVLWEEESTLEDVIEPYLLQIWFIERTPRWRKITNWSKNYTQYKRSTRSFFNPSRFK